MTDNLATIHSEILHPEIVDVRYISPPSKTDFLQLDSMCQQPDLKNRIEMPQSYRDKRSWLNETRRKAPYNERTFIFSPPGELENIIGFANFYPHAAEQVTQLQDQLHLPPPPPDTLDLVVVYGRNAAQPSVQGIISAGVRIACIAIRDMVHVGLPDNSAYKEIRVIAYIEPNNDKSKRVAEKVGFVYQGKITDSYDNDPPIPLDVWILDRERLNRIKAENHPINTVPAPFSDISSAISAMTELNTSTGQ